MKALIGTTRGGSIKGVISAEEDFGKSEIEGRWCVYKNESGEDIARISCYKKNCQGCESKKKIGTFVRFVNNDDLGKIKRIKEYEKNAENVCRSLIKKHALPMKIVRTTLSFDEKKLTFYFVSGERVDFRNLVKDLVARFRKMIRLQQIGSRDHARMVNGVGVCGRELCCALFLDEVNKIGKETAAKQGVDVLGSEKISGACGKLMCCLMYEIDSYNREKE